MIFSLIISHQVILGPEQVVVSLWLYRSIYMLIKWLVSYCMDTSKSVSVAIHTCAGMGTDQELCICGPMDTDTAGYYIRQYSCHICDNYMLQQEPPPHVVGVVNVPVVGTCVWPRG